MLSKLTNINSKIQNNEILNKSLSAFILKIIGAIFTYAFILFVTRCFGAEGWGIFALGLMMLNVLAIFGKLGVDTVLLKYVASYNYNYAKINSLYRKGVKIVCISSLGLSILLFFGSEMIARDIFEKTHLTLTFQIISLTLIPFSLLQLNIQVIRGLKNIKLAVGLKDVLNFFIALLITIVLYYLLDDLHKNTPVISFSISVTILLLLSFIFLYQFKNNDKVESLNINKLLKESFPMMFSTSIVLIMTWVDVFMLGVFMTEGDVGVYNVAVRVSMTTSVILISVNSIVAPKISETYNNRKHDEFKKIISLSVKLIFYCSIPIIFILALFSEFILSLFGPEFAVARDTFLILLLGQLFNTLSGSVGVILNMTGQQKAFRNILFCALLVNILLNYILIPKSGIEGAAIASATSFVIWNLFSVFYIYKQYKVLTIFNPFSR